LGNKHVNHHVRLAVLALLVLVLHLHPGANHVVLANITSKIVKHPVKIALQESTKTKRGKFLANHAELEKHLHLAAVHAIPVQSVDI